MAYCPLARSRWLLRSRTACRPTANCLPSEPSMSSSTRLPSEQIGRPMTGELRLERYDEPSVDRIYDKLVELYADTHRDLAGNVFYTTDRFKDFLVTQRAQPGFDLVAA